MGRRRADFCSFSRPSTDSLRRQRVGAGNKCGRSVCAGVRDGEAHAGEQDEADGKRGKTGGLRGQQKFGGGVQEQESNGDVFINDIWNKNRVFQTAFFKGFRAQKNADADDGYKHDRRHVQMY